MDAVGWFVLLLFGLRGLADVERYMDVETAVDIDLAYTDLGREVRVATVLYRNVVILVHCEEPVDWYLATPMGATRDRAYAYVLSYLRSSNQANCARVDGRPMRCVATPKETTAPWLSDGFVVHGTTLDNWKMRVHQPSSDPVDPVGDRFVATTGDPSEAGSFEVGFRRRPAPGVFVHIRALI